MKYFKKLVLSGVLIWLVYITLIVVYFSSFNLMVAYHLETEFIFKIIDLLLIVLLIILVLLIYVLTPISIYNMFLINKKKKDEFTRYQRVVYTFLNDLAFISGFIFTSISTSLIVVSILVGGIQV